MAKLSFKHELVSDIFVKKISFTLFYALPGDKELIVECKKRMKDNTKSYLTLTRTQLEHILSKSKFRQELLKDYSSTNSQDITAPAFLYHLLQVYRRLKKIEIYFSHLKTPNRIFNDGPYNINILYTLKKIEIDLKVKFGRDYIPAIETFLTYMKKKLSTNDDVKLDVNLKPYIETTAIDLWALFYSPQFSSFPPIFIPMIQYIIDKLNAFRVTQHNPIVILK